MFVVPIRATLLFIPMVVTDPPRVARENRWRDRGVPARAAPGPSHCGLGLLLDEDRDAIREVARRSAARSWWAPRCSDYLYVSVTNSSAQPRRHDAAVTPGEEPMVLVVARAVSPLQLVGDPAWSTS